MPRSHNAARRESFPATVKPMSARARIVALTAVAAAVAAVAAVAVGALQGDRPGDVAAASTVPSRGRGHRRSGSTSGCATIARRATCAAPRGSTRKGDLAGAKALFDRHDSLEARVGSAFASWPDRDP